MSNAILGEIGMSEAIKIPTKKDIENHRKGNLRISEMRYTFLSTLGAL